MLSIQQIFRTKTIFIIFCLVVLYGLFGISGGLLESRLGKAIWNLNHLVAFFIGNLFLFNLFPILKPNNIFNIAALLCAMLVISGGIEFIQKHIGRSPSYEDIKLNMAGSLLAVATYLIFYKVKIDGRYYIATILMSVTLAMTWPNIRFFIAEYVSFRQFPVLADFSKPFTLTSWSSGASKLSIKDEKLEVIFLPGSDYSHIAFKSFFGQWDKYREIVIDIFNPGQDKLDMIIRLHDKHHKKYYYKYEDRFFRHIEITPGDNKITIPVIEIYKAPKSRRMDLKNLEELIMFMSDLEHPRTIIINKMYLR